MTKLLIVIAIAFSFVAGASAQSAGWFVGDEHSSVSGPAGTDDLELKASADLNATARHIRLVASDGNFEFENRTGLSHLYAYIAGTPTRTPVVVGGGDEQNVRGLIVDSGATQTKDLQQWQKSGVTMTAIDPKGRLRMNGIALSLGYQGSQLVLQATMPDGSIRTVAFK